MIIGIFQKAGNCLYRHAIQLTRTLPLCYIRNPGYETRTQWLSTITQTMQAQFGGRKEYVKFGARKASGASANGS